MSSGTAGPVCKTVNVSTVFGTHGLNLNDTLECRCSRQDPRRNTAAVAAINFCAIPCNGDSNQRCGGWGYVDLYSAPVSGTPGTSNNTAGNGVPTLPGYQGRQSPLARPDADVLGCFNGSQPLPAYNWWNGAMTVEQCTQGCKEIGQPLAALNSGTVCRMCPLTYGLD